MCVYKCMETAWVSGQTGITVFGISTHNFFSEPNVIDQIIIAFIYSWFILMSSSSG